MGIKIDANDPVLGEYRSVRYSCGRLHRTDAEALTSQERGMIVCSCNVLSDGQVRCAIATAVSSARISHVYASLGCAAKCGRCAHTIKIILEDTFAPLAKESVS
jgi:bacterioferritin-associated ferredoxin